MRIKCFPEVMMKIDIFNYAAMEQPHENYAQCCFISHRGQLASLLNISRGTQCTKEKLFKGDKQYFKVEKNSLAVSVCWSEFILKWLMLV